MSVTIQILCFCSILVIISGKTVHYPTYSYFNQPQQYGYGNQNGYGNQYGYGNQNGYGNPYGYINNGYGYPYSNYNPMQLRSLHPRAMPENQGNNHAAKIPLLGFRNGAIIDYEYIFDINDMRKPKSSSVTIVNAGRNHAKNNEPMKHNLADGVSVETLISQGNNIEFKTQNENKEIETPKERNLEKDTDVNKFKEPTLWTEYKQIPQKPPPDDFLEDDFDDDDDYREEDLTEEDKDGSEPADVRKLDVETTTAYSWFFGGK